MFIEARFSHDGRIRPCRMVVWHDMEWAESITTAEQCAEEFRRTNTPKSAHICADTNSVVECVKPDDTAFAAPGGNSDGYQVELHGFARQTAAEWLDQPSKMAIDNAAHFLVPVVKKFAIPTRFLTLDQVADGVTKGHTTHADITKVFKQSTHTDPGPAFPRSFVIERMNLALGSVQVKPKPVPATKPVRTVPPFPREVGDDGVIKRGDRGREVVALQNRLVQRGWKVTIDGVFGDETDTAVLGFEREKHLQAIPGVVGPGVWKALWMLPVT
jgi:N-acetyl-anhydromuramyl-L-alanine amidase AmpD